MAAHGRGSLVDNEGWQGERRVEEDSGLQKGEDVHDQLVWQRKRPHRHP